MTAPCFASSAAGATTSTTTTTGACGGGGGIIVVAAAASCTGAASTAVHGIQYNNIIKDDDDLPDGTVRGGIVGLLTVFLKCVCVGCEKVKDETLLA
jgi:hypothetical protein